MTITAMNITATVFELCKRLDCAPCHICDPFTNSLSPVMLEELLKRRGQYDSGRSIAECVERFYGPYVTKLCEEAI